MMASDDYDYDYDTVLPNCDMSCIICLLARGTTKGIFPMCHYYSSVFYCISSELAFAMGLPITYNEQPFYIEHPVAFIVKVVPWGGWATIPLIPFIKA